MTKTGPTPILEAFSPPAGLIDLRKTAAQVHHKGDKHPDGLPVTDRAWSQVRGITLHQSGVRLGSDPQRYNTLAAHFGVMADGRPVWCHDLNRLVWHGQGWSNQCVGIEIDGNFAGVEGDQRTVWKGKADELTTAQVLAACELIRWICSLTAQHGGRIKILGYHRQASPTRPACPGEAIARRIGLPMSKELGLHDGGPGFSIGGRPTPENWDPSRVGITY